MDPATALAPREPEAAVSMPIRKPLPPQHFVDHGTNAEMRWDVPHGPGDTPASRLFVRNHTETPLLDAATYTLMVHGDGLRRAAVITLDDLRALPVTRTTCAHECTGNGRSYFATQQGRGAPGTPWHLGSIGQVTWEGVRLAEVLERLGLRDDAVDVMATGLDPSYVDDDGVDNGPVRRPLPITKALDDTPAGVGDERGTAAARPRVPAAPGRARLGRGRQHQVARLARGRHPSARVALEHEVVPDDRRRLPRRRAAADPEPGAQRLGAAGAGLPARRGAVPCCTGAPGVAPAPSRRSR